MCLFKDSVHICWLVEEKEDRKALSQANVPPTPSVCAATDESCSDSSFELSSCRVLMFVSV